MKQVMYVVINQDLGMTPGKIGAHVGHAVFDFCKKIVDDIYKKETEEYIDEWTEASAAKEIIETMSLFKDNGDTIITLKAHEKDLLKWEHIGYVAVRDRGLTEVPENSITAVCLGVYDKDKEIPKWLKRIRKL